MQKREIKGLDRSATSEQERAQTTAKHGRKGYSRKFEKESSRSRRKGGRANGGKRRQREQRQTAYKIADLLPQDTIKKLKEMGR